MTQQWTVGQEVLIIPSSNASGYRNPLKPKLATVEKVGWKYFTVVGATGQFHIQTGWEKTDYPGSARSVRTPQFHDRVLRQEAANRRLFELGLNDRGGRLPYTVEQLEAIIAILETDR